MVGHVLFTKGFLTVFAFLVLLCFFAAFCALGQFRFLSLGSAENREMDVINFVRRLA